MKGPLGISRLTCDVRRKHRNFFRFWPKLATDCEAILRKEATMITYIELSVFALLLSITSVYGGDVCYDWVSGDAKYCSYGCCGTFDSDCCDANVALIVGLTVLGILIVSVIIAVICCVRRRRAAAGTVLSTQPQPATTGYVVQSGPNHTTVTTMGQPMGAYPYGTQVVSQGTYAPPAYPIGTAPPPPQPYPYGAPGPVPAQQPYGGAMAPPPYSSVAGQDNTGYKQ